MDPIEQELLEVKVHELMDLMKEVESLNEKIEELKSYLKQEMEMRGEYVLSGHDWEITWNLVSSRRFDQSWFKRENADMFEKYISISESRRFLVKDKSM